MDDSYYDGSAGLLFLALIFAVVAFVFAIAFYVLTSFFFMRVFDKAGVEGRWRAWVPGYNYAIFLRLGDLQWWLVFAPLAVGIVLGWIPYIGPVLFNLVAVALLSAASLRVGQKLGKKPTFALLVAIPGVLAFIPGLGFIGFLGFLLWLGINAFDKSVWQPVVGPSPWATTFLADRAAPWRGIPAQPQEVGNAVRTDLAGPPPGYAPPPPAGYAPPPPPAGYAPPPPAGYAPPPPPPTTEPPSADEPPRV